MNKPFLPSTYMKKKNFLSRTKASPIVITGVGEDTVSEVNQSEPIVITAKSESLASTDINLIPSIETSNRYSVLEEDKNTIGCFSDKDKTDTPKKIRRSNRLTKKLKINNTCLIKEQLEYRLNIDKKLNLINFIPNSRTLMSTVSNMDLKPNIALNKPNNDNVDKMKNSTFITARESYFLNASKIRNG